MTKNNCISETVFFSGKKKLTVSIYAPTKASDDAWGVQIKMRSDGLEFEDTAIGSTSLLALLSAISAVRSKFDELDDRWTPFLNDSTPWHNISFISPLLDEGFDCLVTASGMGLYEEYCRNWHSLQRKRSALPSNPNST